MKIAVSDQTLSRKESNRIELDFDREAITVRDLIQSRVAQEVASYNNSCSIPYSGLITPEDKELLLNDKFNPSKRRTIDAEKQVYVALDSFEKNRYFILVNEKQVLSLEEELDLSLTNEVVFTKLVQLVGG